MEKKSLIEKYKNLTTKLSNVIDENLTIKFDFDSVKVGNEDRKAIDREVDELIKKTFGKIDGSSPVELLYWKPSFDSFKLEEKSLKVYFKNIPPILLNGTEMKTETEDTEKLVDNLEVFKQQIELMYKSFGNSFEKIMEKYAKIELERQKGYYDLVGVVKGAERIEGNRLKDIMYAGTNMSEEQKEMQANIAGMNNPYRDNSAAVRRPQ